MNAIKLFDAEWNLMCFIWEHQPATARQTAAYALEAFGWKKNTTYTVLKRLAEKKVLRREDPGFFVVPLMQKQQVQQAEAVALLEKRFGGDMQALSLALQQAGYNF